MSGIVYRNSCMLPCRCRPFRQQDRYLFCQSHLLRKRSPRSRTGTGKRKP